MFFGLKILKKFDADPGPRSCQPWIRDRINGIRYKHHRSATMVKNSVPDLQHFGTDPDPCILDCLIVLLMHQSDSKKYPSYCSCLKVCQFNIYYVPVILLTGGLFNIHSYNKIVHSFILDHLPRPVFLYLHRFSAQQQKPPLGAEPRIELGPALQLADSLPAELRRTLLSYAAP